MEAYEVLEESFGRWAGVENVVACASGSAALHLALEALRLPPGSEVLVPDFSMIACPRAVTMANLVPVFIDCGDDLLMDQGLLSAVPGTPKAIMFVHVYGRQVKLTGRTLDYIRRMRMAVVEDLAEAHGVKVHPSTDAACWSFYRNKIVAGEEGGAVAFRDPRHAALARQLRSLGFTDSHDFAHIPRGHNYRISNVHARLILDSLRNYPWIELQRREIEGWYEAVCPDGWRMPRRDAVWIYDVRIPGLTRDRQTEVVLALNALGIAARHSFLPMSQQEEYKNCRVVGTGRALSLSNEVFYLPVAPGHTTQATAEKAFHTIHDVLG